MTDDLGASWAQTEREKRLEKAIHNAAWKVILLYDLPFTEFDELLSMGRCLMFEIKSKLEPLDNARAAAYLCACCYNQALNEYKLRRKEDSYPNDKLIVLAVETTDEEEQTELEKKRDEQRAFILAYVDAMKVYSRSKVKEVVYKTLEGLNTGEIAQDLKTKSNNICSILKNFIRSIKINLGLEQNGLLKTA